MICRALCFFRLISSSIPKGEIKNPYKLELFKRTLWKRCASIRLERKHCLLFVRGTQFFFFFITRIRPFCLANSARNNNAPAVRLAGSKWKYIVLFSKQGHGKCNEHRCFSDKISARLVKPNISVGHRHISKPYRLRNNRVNGLWIFLAAEIRVNKWRK